MLLAPAFPGQLVGFDYGPCHYIDCPVLRRIENNTKKDESILARFFRVGSASSKNAAESYIGHLLIKCIKNLSLLTEHVAALHHLSLVDTFVSCVFAIALKLADISMWKCEAVKVDNQCPSKLFIPKDIVRPKISMDDSQGFDFFL